MSRLDNTNDKYPPLDPPCIIALEGASGSGKGYHIEGLKSLEPDLYCIERSPLPRVTGPKLGAHASNVNEYTAISYSTIYQQGCVVDRFLLSRPIYQHIETGWKGFNVERAAASIRSSWLNLTQAAMQEARFRLDPNAIYLRPVVELCVLLPTPEHLYMTRTKGIEKGRAYPYAGTEEANLYRELAQYLIDNPINGIVINPIYLGL